MILYDRTDRQDPRGRAPGESARLKRALCASVVMEVAEAVHLRDVLS